MSVSLSTAILNVYSKPERPYVTKGEVSEYFDAQNKPFEDRKVKKYTDHQCVFFIAFSIFLSVGIFIGYLGYSDGSLVFMAMGGILGVAAIATLIPGIITTVKKHNYLNKQLDAPRLDNYLQKMKKQAQERLDDIEKDHKYGHILEPDRGYQPGYISDRLSTLRRLETLKEIPGAA